MTKRKQNRVAFKDISKQERLEAMRWLRDVMAAYKQKEAATAKAKSNSAAQR